MRSQLEVRTKAGFGGVRSKVESVTVEGATATVVSCAFDAATLYDINDPANPDDDVVFDDSQNSTRSQWHMALTNGHWLPASSTQLETQSGGTLCGF